MNSILEDAAKRAISYLDGLDKRGVAPSGEAVLELSALRESVPIYPVSPEAVIAQLDEVCSPATMGISGRRFFGFVAGGAVPAALAANWLAAAWDQNTALYIPTPATSFLEQIALGWVLDILNLPEDGGGAFVTGATMANFSALAAARHDVLQKAGWDVESDGLFGAPPITVIIGDEAHPSLIKALGMVGLGRKRTVRIPVDGQGRMITSAIPAISGPTIVCTQAGNVNTGAFDPIGRICEAVPGAWVHVDGAFGLWASAVPSLQELSSGIERADSWATDFHKWLNVPFDSGLAVVRNREALRAAMAVTAEYLPTETSFRNPCDYAPELSRRARGVEVWAALKSLGRNGLIDLIERNCRQARRFAEGLKAAGYEILNDVVLNQVLVAFGDSVKTNRVITGIQKDGTCWCGGTVWQGRTAMRISVSSWATRDEDIEESLEAMIRIAGKADE